MPSGEDLEDESAARYRFLTGQQQPTCDHVGTGRVRKYDGGNRPLLCGWCYLIIGRWRDVEPDGFEESYNPVIFEQVTRPQSHDPRKDTDHCPRCQRHRWAEQMIAERELMPPAMGAEYLESVRHDHYRAQSLSLADWGFEDE